jgi:heterodisulfide reductase subunit A
MVILCPAIEACSDAEHIARIFNIGRRADGFFLELHPKLAPVNTPTDGVFIAGCCESPKDIPDTVAQASAAAAEALSLISKGRVTVEVATAIIDEERCCGCKICNNLCPFSAISYKGGKNVFQINEFLCKGCGVCAAACPSEAITAKHFTNGQIMAQIEGMLI